MPADSASRELPAFGRKLLWRRQLPSCVCLLLLLLSPLSSLAAYVDQLIDSARSKQLAGHAYWWQLLHYEQKMSGVRSQADTPGFFLSPSGKTDPQAELEATIRSFFGNASTPDESAQCLFIARYRWLKAQLDIDSTRLPESPCHQFRDWIKGIDGDRATLVFASDYINNPSSMFGHTLLRLDTPSRDERTRILSYTLNFAAQTRETNGVLFAINGLTGGYPGMYSLLPYYEKIKEYNDMESRDLWEYQLTFSRDEIERMLAHVWELRQVSFPYYFLSDNCSWHLLTLLEIGRPELKLSDQFPFYAIPADTLRAITQKHGLVSDIVYRPASGTRLNHRITSNSTLQNKLALQMAKGLYSPEGNDAQTDVVPALETAYDYLFYRYNSGKLTAEERPRLRSLLSQRASMEASSPYAAPPRPLAAPSDAHNTSTAELSLGYRNSQGFVQIAYRPAYHEPIDPAPGYRPGSSIDFLHGELRVLEGGSIDLERLTVVSIESLSPYNAFFTSTSWFLDTAIENMPLEQGLWTTNQRHLTGLARGGAGLAFATANASTPCYGFAETALISGPATANPGNLGAGIRIGCQHIVDRFSLAADLRRTGWTGRLEASTHVTLRGGISLARNLSLQLRWDSLSSSQVRLSSSMIGLRLYF